MVGRVRKGLEIIEQLNDVVVGPDSIPFQKVTITKSGETNSNGDFEEVESVPMTREDAMARLKTESASARTAVLEALEVGLSSGANKRKAAPQEDAAGGPSSSGGAGTSAPPAAKQLRGDGKAAAAAATHKSKALDALLGSLSDDDDDDSSGGE